MSRNWTVAAIAGDSSAAAGNQRTVFVKRLGGFGNVRANLLVAHALLAYYGEKAIEALDREAVR